MERAQERALAGGRRDKVQISVKFGGMRDPAAGSGLSGARRLGEDSSAGTTCAARGSSPDPVQAFGEGPVRRAGTVLPAPAPRCRPRDRPAGTGNGPEALGEACGPGLKASNGSYSK